MADFEFETRREKKIRESIEFMFKGLDDDVLKTVMLYTALAKSDEEKEKAIEKLKRLREEDEERAKYFEITDIREVVGEGRVVEMTPALDSDLSQDNITNESACGIWQSGEGHESVAPEHPDDGVHTLKRKHEE